MIQTDCVTGAVIGSAIEVHRALGPGLLESVYVTCLMHELDLRGLIVEREKVLPVAYKGVELDTGYRADLIVNNEVIVEVKSVMSVLPVHEAQLLSYLKLSGIKTGLLMNFNEVCLKHGLKRFSV